MSKEERVLFPYVIRMEAAANQGVPLFRPPFGTVANPVRMMMLEHDRAGDLLKQIRVLSSDFTTPADGCLSYQTLYEALAGLEKKICINTFIWRTTFCFRELSRWESTSR